jgi:hypothetical protein
MPTSCLMRCPENVEGWFIYNEIMKKTPLWCNDCGDMVPFKVLGFEPINYGGLIITECTCCKGKYGITQDYTIFDR